MEDVIKLLERMGCVGVEYVDNDGSDEYLTFIFDDSEVYISGIHLNDGFGGICAEINVYE